ncbi:unnamed protein product [Caenorhabditis angaria]|uniref:Uncharacterized protein n=1 Tax=Caenorhabditis angaria TaxID=860376 RepID=A0A9P1MXH7_9PELO|nr:unnamed protein product [Caenorhabditis angaria]
MRSSSNLSSSALNYLESLEKSSKALRGKRRESISELISKVRRQTSLSRGNSDDFDGLNDSFNSSESRGEKLLILSSTSSSESTESDSEATQIQRILPRGTPGNKPARKSLDELRELRNSIDQSLIPDVSGPPKKVGTEKSGVEKKSTSTVPSSSSSFSFLTSSVPPSRSSPTVTQTSTVLPKKSPFKKQIESESSDAESIIFDEVFEEPEVKAPPKVRPETRPEVRPKPKPKPESSSESESSESESEDEDSGTSGSSESESESESQSKTSKSESESFESESSETTIRELSESPKKPGPKLESPKNLQSEKSESPKRARKKSRSPKKPETPKQARKKSEKPRKSRKSKASKPRSPEFSETESEDYPAASCSTNLHQLMSTVISDHLKMIGDFNRIEWESCQEWKKILENFEKSSENCANSQNLRKIVERRLKNRVFYE